MTTTVDRQVVREAFALLLTNNITDLQAVYDYMVSDFDGKTPVATILSSGSIRPPLTSEGPVTGIFLSANLWTLYASPDDSWTEADAEDKADDLERQFANVVSSNRQTANWNFLTYDGRSIVRVVPVGGVPYLHEAIPIRIEVFA